MPAGGIPEWRPGQDWNPGAGWQQEQQQVPWWLAPSQPGQQDPGQQGFNQQGFNQGYGPQATGPLTAGPQAAGPQGTGPQGPNFPVPSGGGRPSRLPLIAVTIAAAALLGAGAGAYVLLAHPFSSPTGTAARGSSVANVSQSTPASAVRDAQFRHRASHHPGSVLGRRADHAARHPAAEPAGYPEHVRAPGGDHARGAAVAESSDRSAINDAYNDAYSCGGNLSGGPADLHAGGIQPAVPAQPAQRLA